MRKIFLLIFFCIAQPLFIFSQTPENRSTIYISVDAAVPTGQFSSTDLLDSKPGFAKIGEEVSISFSAPLTKKWSFITHFQGQRNPLNTNDLESRFSQAKIYQGFSLGADPNNPPPQTSYKVYPAWKFEKKSWLYGALLLGGQRQFYVDRSGGFNLFGRFLVGAVYAKSPKLNGSSITDTATAHIEQSKSSAFGFIYSFAGGLNYNLTKTIFLNSTLAYFGTNQMKFKDVKTTLTTTEGTFGSPEYSVQQSTTTENGKQTISSVNISVGIGIRL